VNTEKGLEHLIIGNRIPYEFFISKGTGESDITVHAGSFHLAMKEAGIERFNCIPYTSILPAIAREVSRPKDYVHGSVAEYIVAISNVRKGERATAGIIYGWLYDKGTKKKHGGLVCEYGGNDSEREAQDSLRRSLEEIYTSGFSEQYELQEPRVITKTFLPQKKFGTALVALTFTSYQYPILGKK